MKGLATEKAHEWKFYAKRGGKYAVGSAFTICSFIVASEPYLLPAYPQCVILLTASLTYMNVGLCNIGTGVGAGAGLAGCIVGCGGL